MARSLISPMQSQRWLQMGLVSDEKFPIHPAIPRGVGSKTVSSCSIFGCKLWDLTATVSRQIEKEEGVEPEFYSVMK